MTDIPDLTDWLAGQPDVFETKKKIFGKTIVHKPSGEKVVEGYRYFRSSIDELVDAFESGDLAAVQALEYALDEDGDADTSAVALLLAYTKNGAFLAAQPEEYQDYVPVRVRAPRYFPGSTALVKELDQTS
ncbi:hypothetical protein Cch01nite_23180 [Cellulomonas chitinilytica]|uniref:Uncharacterized protein n=1 Tax=Cellulomonas chitinilytica TaxID=398759 RepID=A0A919U2Y1_9CELL|nr:hypothetical protein [Cellulomonas chitinilytica]GIG21594.1 hypothetical protein Cch01nite_23180 [Cellulomonas chitinilytica]